MSQNDRYPLQPLVFDADGRLRFRGNPIVRRLLDLGKSGTRFDLNTLADMSFTDEDWEQFAQLIGYSVAGFSTLSYVSDETYGRVQQAKSQIAVAQDDVRQVPSDLGDAHA